MITSSTLRPARCSLVFVLLLAALIPMGCGPSYQQLFQASLAKEALACMHPRGVYQGATDFKDEGDGVYSGIIHWKGTTLENEHTTKVRFKVEEGVAKVYLIEDSAFLPAAQQNCEIPIVAKD